MLMYRVVWQERKKPTCRCCVDANHPWVDRHSLPQPDLKEAEKFQGKVYNSELEVRNVDLESADIEWKAHHSC